MRKRSILLVAGALALVASLVIGPAATAKPQRTSAGTVVFGHDQEPSTLNPFVTEGSNTPTPLAMNPVLGSGGIYNNKAAGTRALGGAAEDPEGGSAHGDVEVQAECGLE